VIEGGGAGLLPDPHRNEGGGQPADDDSGHG